MRYRNLRAKVDCHKFPRLVRQDMHRNDSVVKVLGTNDLLKSTCHSSIKPRRVSRPKHPLAGSSKRAESWAHQKTYKFLDIWSAFVRAIKRKGKPRTTHCEPHGVVRLELHISEVLTCVYCAAQLRRNWLLLRCLGRRRRRKRLNKRAPLPPRHAQL